MPLALTKFLGSLLATLAALDLVSSPADARAKEQKRALTA